MRRQLCEYSAFLSQKRFDFLVDIFFQIAQYLSFVLNYPRVVFSWHEYPSKEAADAAQTAPATPGAATPAPTQP